MNTNQKISNVMNIRSEVHMLPTGVTHESPLHIMLLINKNQIKIK
jgi:hypothetical protein